MTSELIITNGDSAGTLLRHAMPGVEVLPWRDVLHEGPVPLTGSLADLTDIRANYLARDSRDIDETRMILQARDRGLARSASFDRTVLWFEHDLYDQLQLLQVLDWFSAHGDNETSLRLVQASDFLGNQTPESIVGFRQLERKVTEEQLKLASEAWAAFRASTPEPWAKLLENDLPALPFLNACVHRMLEELPGRDGLSRTERQTLAAVKQGATTPSALFASVQQQEEAVFMGDRSFFRLLDDLALAQEPLIAGLEAAPFRPNGCNTRQSYFQSTLSLTPFGKDVLTDRADHASRNRIDRWWGGTHLTNDKLWRWDADKEEPIPPAD
jgi:hypothetical protein